MDSRDFEGFDVIQVGAVGFAQSAERQPRDTDADTARDEAAADQAEVGLEPSEKQR